MKQIEAWREFDGGIDGVPHVFYAEKIAGNENIHLVIYQKDGADFNTVDNPRYRLMIKSATPERYELMRSIGFALYPNALRYIVRQTLYRFAR